MIELVDSLLNVSRLEVGKLKNEPQDTSMQEISASLMKELQTSITNKNMNITAKITPTLKTVFADPKLLRMVVQNLMTNAIKYTPENGHIVLTMREAIQEDVQTAKLQPGHYFYMSVADDGFGIPKEQQDKIFQKLFRADNVRKLDVEGTGLGLYIVKEVAEKLGGTVWFESAEGKGTTFHVLVPFKTQPA
jgi:signal transduction histidine kinase